MVRDQSRVAFIAVTEIKTSTSPIIFPPPLAWIAPNPAAGVGRFGRFAIRVILIDPVTAPSAPGRWCRRAQDVPWEDTVAGHPCHVRL
jgi:hypothetical protein